MTESSTQREAIAAGGVVYRHVDGRVEIVIVGRSKSKLWALPKGRPEPGETLEQAALREVGEETGLQVEIVGEVGSDRYSFPVPEEGARVNKVVRHFLMEPRGGDFSLHDEEYDRVRWVDINEAFRLLTFPSQRVIVERASTLIADREQR